MRKIKEILVNLLDKYIKLVTETRLRMASYWLKESINHQGGKV